MRKEEIIAKGAYAAPQFGELISVRQFIMVRRKGEKQLLLRLRNDRAEQADAVSFRVKQYDAKGNLVGTETVVERNLSAKGGADFSLQKPVKLSRACIDFTVEMISADYGDYTYHLHGGKLTSSYESRSENPPVDKESISKQLRGKSSRVTAKSLSAPRFLAAAMVLILLVIGTFAFLQLKNFMATEEFFTLENVEYRFETANHTDGPISIVGYNGKAGTLIIPESIEGHAIVGIADGAFEGKPLRSVTVLGSPYIGQRAFADCRYMDTVTIENVTEIADGAFADCRDLKELTLSPELTVLPASVFSGCSSLKQISLPDGLLSVGSAAFAGCDKLTEIVIPDSVSDMGENVFVGCTSVTTLTAPYAGMDRDGQNGIGYFFGGSVQIPNSLENVVLTRDTDLQDGDFDGCDHVLSVTLPDAMAEIGANTFNECARLETIHLPEQLTVIGAYAFDGCGKLADVQLPSALTEIGAGAFRSCTALTSVTVPAGVKTLSENVFAACTGLESIALPAELDQIQTGALKDCTGLTRLDVPASVSSMQKGIVSGCTALEELTVPFVGESYEAPGPLSHLFDGENADLKKLTVRNANEIAENAFTGFSGLTNITLLGDTQRIGDRAFADCANLQTVLLPASVTEIGAYAFEGCASLPALELPAQMTVIREGLFANCSALHDVSIPGGVKTVESRAFAGCAALTDASWLGNVETLGEYVFESCTALETATLPEVMTAVPNGTFSGCTALHTATLPSDTTLIGERAFYGCSALQNAAIPGKTVEIMKEAFSDCSALTTVNLPSSVTVLGESAFAGCSSVKALTIPTSVTSLGRGVIARCTALESLTTPFVGSSRISAEKLTYMTAGDAPRSLTYVCVTDTTDLADGAFSGCSYITSIQLSSGLNTIGASAFENCSALTGMTVPATVSEIGASAFHGCRSMTEIYIPNSVVFLQENLLEGCSSLKKITTPYIGTSRENPNTLSYFFAGKDVPVSLTQVILTNAQTLAPSTFEDCRRIESIVLDCDLVEVGARAFGNCTSLQSLTLPDTVTRINAYAFEGCTGLKAFEIPQAVTYVGTAAFYRCTALRELETPFVGTSRDGSSVFTDMFGGAGNVPSKLAKVTVTDSTVVVDNAFNGCSKISGIIYVCDVTSIGNSAFENCSSLARFALPKTVADIGDAAFRNCRAMTEVSIPQSVTRIGDGAFENCDGLTKIVVPNSTEYVGDRAFSDCDHLATATVGSKATYIGQYAFDGCNDLGELTVPFVGGTPDDGNGVAYWFQKVPSELKKVTVTNSTAVKAYAFTGMDQLESVTYTRNIESIGDSAFFGCVSLPTFDMPDTVTSIGSSAFYNCSALTKLNLSAGLVTIGEAAFYNCDGLTKITLSDGIESVGANAFYDCNSLTAVTVGDTATYIGRYAFGACNRLAELTVPFVGETPDDGNGLACWFITMPSALRKVTVTNSTRVKDSAFYGLSSIKEITYTQDIESIGDSAFYGCASISKFNTPDTLTYIGANAFYNCSGLTKLSLTTGPATIGDSAFYNCDGLTKVAIPDGVETIGTYAFAGCDNLTSVTVGDTATAIGQYAFSDCNNLAELTVPFVGGTTADSNGLIYWFSQYSWGMPSSLTKITVTNSTTVKDYAFQNCHNLEEVVYTRDIVSIGSYAFSDCTSLPAFDVPDTVTSIGSYAFQNCTSLTSMDLSADSLSIGGSAFYNCIGLTSLEMSSGPASIGEYAFYNCDGLTRVEIPDGIESIGTYAFYGCNNLTSVTVGDTATYIGQNAFRECTSLAELTVPFVGGTPDDQNGLTHWMGDSWNIPDTLKKVTVTNSTTVKSSAFSGMSNLEEIVYTRDVSSIGEYAFYNCDGLTEFVIPNGVETIGDYAFYNCSGLTEIDIPDGIETIGEHAFQNCSNLTSVTIGESATSIGWYAFRYCNNITEMTVPFVGGTPDDSNSLGYWFGDAWSIPSSLTKITVTNSTAVKNYAFQNVRYLTEIVYTQDVESIGEYAFYNCDGLTDFVIPETVETIGTYAFAGCDNLTVTDLPEGLVTIGNYAFYDCGGLTEIVIPDGIETIGEYAFQNCSNLTSVTIGESATSIGQYVFRYCNSLAELTVPFVGGTPDDSNSVSYWFDSWNIPSSLKKITVTNSTTVTDSAFYNMSYLEEIVYTQDITAIGNSAFYGCTALLGFDLPDTLTSIGENTFYNCYNMVDVELPASLETIGNYAFYNCDGLTALEIPETVESIGYNSFCDCNGLTELTVPFVGGTPDDSNGLGYWFGDTWNTPSSLKKITVTNSTTVKNYAFQSAPYIEEIVYTLDVTSVGYQSFYNCTALKTVELGDAIETIGEYAFASCRALHSFTIPATCQTVGYNAFSWSYALFEVYNESSLVFDQWDGTGLRDNCLVYRDDDTAVTKASVNGFDLLLADNGDWYVVDYTGSGDTLSFPARVAEGDTVISSYRIAPYAFYNRRDIRSVTIPAAVTNIDNQAFQNCENLREVYNLSALTITKGSSNHGYVAYYAYIVHNSEEAESLNTVQIGDFEFLKSDDTWFLVNYHGEGGEVVLDAFTYNGEPISYAVMRSAFENRYGITSLTITDAVTAIESNAFQSMGSLEYLYIEDNTTLTRIPQYAFAWCYSLKQVTLPSTLTEIAYDAFWGCNNLREVYNLSSLELTLGSSDHGAVAYYAYIIHDSLDDPALTEVRINDFVFLNSGDTWLLVRYEGSEAHIVLDEFTYNGKTVNAYAIMNNAFSYNNTIESVEIGNAVKSIGREAFYYCYKLQSVSFEENTSITTILPYTFAYSHCLDRVVLPASLTEIQHDAFWDCINLFEIYNLSSIVLTPGDSGNGSVAAYAKAIYTSMDEEGLGIVNVDFYGNIYKFIREDGEWCLYYRYQYNWYDGYLHLPELVIDGENVPYRVNISVSGYSRLVIYGSINYLDWTVFAGSEIFFRGTPEEFDALTEGFDVARYSVRYYADCIHSNNQWNYSSNGYLSTSMNCSSSTIKEPNCSEKGIIEYYCYTCQKTWEEETNHYGTHELNEDLECRLCGAHFESRTLEDMWAVTNDAYYPFDITEDGEIVSTNHEHSRSATITLQALQDMVFSYHYFVSTENWCDMLIIRHNGVDITYAGGIVSDSIPGNTLDIAAGDIITITYTKDGSVHTGDDTVKVLNLVYLVEEAGDDNA